MQQFTKDGNLRHRILNWLPTGLIHNTICNEFLIPSTKKVHKDSGESNLFALIANGLIVLYTYSKSSFLANKLGTSPVLRILLISSKKLS